MSLKNLLHTGVAVGVASAAFVALPGSASAAFDASHDTTCEVSGAVTAAGVGASFQREAQLAWGAEVLAPNAGGPFASGFGYLDVFNASTNATGHGCADAALVSTSPLVKGSTAVTYEPTGSGAGRRAFGASTVSGQAGIRNTNFVYGGADEAPTSAEIAAANEGPTTGSSDDAVLHTIPVAQSSVAVVVKLPANCNVVADPAERRISRTALAAAFAGTATTWSAVLPNATLTGAGCSTSVKRVVRLDSSGTSFAFKGYLESIDPTSFSGLANTAWPNEGTNAVVRGAANGAGSQLDALNARADGGIAYADLATARDKGFDWDDDLATADDDQTFWVYVQRSTLAYASPAVSDDQSATGSQRGSNCATTTYANTGGGALPSTTQSWFGVSANETSGGYSLCALTYGLAWERPSQANVGSAQPLITQDQARVARDYLGYVVEDKNGLNGTPRAGQSQLAAAGYQKLPEAVRTQARTGVQALNW